MIDKKLDQKRWQYGLPALFGIVTFLSVAFAYPRFVLVWSGLLIGAIIMLLVFIVAVYFPVTFIAKRLDSTTDNSDTDNGTSGEHKS